MTKVKEERQTLRNRDNKVLKKELAELETVLQKTRVNVAFGQLKMTSLIAKRRKQIARIKTILREKEASHA